MDSKKLEALVTAVEQGSFTKAAAILGYTQSGLTHMMNGLEKGMGFPLLVRSRSGVRLTEEGRRIYPMVQECIRAYQTLEREIGLVRSHKEVTIHLAAYASIATHWLPEVIESFRSRYPGVSVDILMGSVEEVYRWVREGKVDMAFASRQESGDTVWTHLKDDPLLAILPRDYPLDGEGSFAVKRFDGQEFLMPSLGFELDIMPVLLGSGVMPNIQTTQVSDGAVISMVEHGLGVSILSQLVLQGRQNAVRSVPLSPPAVRELGIVSRPVEELRSPARKFLRTARDMIRQM